MILLDTHVLLWSRSGAPQIGPRCRRLIERGRREGKLAVSAFSFWELALLNQKGRIRLLEDVRAWRTRLLRNGLVEIPVDGDIAIRANNLDDFHADPADRIIVSTALGGHSLLTADERILNWCGNLRCVDVRR